MTQENEPKVVDSAGEPVGTGSASPEQLREIEEGRYYTAKELSSKINYSIQWIAWMCRNGRIQAVKPFGAQWRIPRSEGDRIISQGLPAIPRPQPPKPQDDDDVVRIRVSKEKAEKVRPKQPESEKEKGLLDFLFD